MAHYRKIDTRILLDEKFNALSSDGRLIFFHLLVHLNLTSLGAMHASLAGIASELNWSVERFRNALEETQQQEMVHYDERARFIWLPNFLKYNIPESPNVIKSWETAVGYLPECALREKLIFKVKKFVDELPKVFQEALPDCFQQISTPFERGCQKIAPPFESHPHPLSEGSEENGLPLSKGYPENQPPLSKPLSIKHKALSIKQEQEQEAKEVLQENNSEEKKRSRK